LRVVPGSHAWGSSFAPVEFAAEGTTIAAGAQLLETVPDVDDAAVVADAGMGDVVAFDARLLKKWEFREEEKPARAEGAGRPYRGDREGGGKPFRPEAREERPRGKPGWDGKPRETLSRLVAQTDILFGNYRDVGLLLDRHFSGEGEHRRREAAEAAFKAFPQLRLMASTARHVEDSDRHRISARVDTPDRGFQTNEILLSGIVDRIGAGDSFAAGILHGLLEDMALEDVAQAGLALTALKHSLPGDASLFNRRDLAAFLEGGLDVRR
jgi:hypothetical protein